MIRDEGVRLLSDADVEAVAARVVELLRIEAGHRLLTASQAADILGVPETWLRAEQRAGRVPHVRLGHYVRFEREALTAWWRARTLGPVAGARPVSIVREAA